jgi:hypothetical protein
VDRAHGKHGVDQAVSRVILSLLHLVLTIRAFLRSLSERFLFGIVVGLVRAALMVVGAIVSAKQATLFMLPGMTLRSPGSSSAPSGADVGILLVTILGPILTFAVLWVSWRRYQDVTAAREEVLRRPFDAWLPVGVLDAIYVVISVGAVWFVEHP